MKAGGWLRFHWARLALALGLLLAVAGALPSGAHAAGGPQSGEFGNPASEYMQYTFSGADFSGDPGGDFHYEGVSTGSKLSLSGTMSVNRSRGGKSYVTMKATLGDQSAAWPAKGADSTVMGRSVQLPFNLSFTIPRGYSTGYVSGEVNLTYCGDWVCAGYAVRFTIKVPQQPVSGSGKAGTPTGGSDGDSDSDALADNDDGGGGLSDAGGGLLAILTILISLVATVRKPGGDEFDKTRPVGYVLELSTRRIELSGPGTSGSLVATVHEVYHDGRTEISADAEISFSPPAGVGVSPAAGVGSVSTIVAHEGPVMPGATLVVSASTPGGGHQDTVEIVATVPTGRLVVAFEPAGKSTLAAYGGDSVTLVGRIVSEAEDAVDPAMAEAARASIDFQRGSDWLDMSAVVDWPGARAVRVMASTPNPGHPTQPPESVTVTCTATIDGAVVSETVALALAPNPSIDAAPATVHFAADSGETVEVRAWIENGSGLTWSFRTEWRDGSEPLAEVAVVAEEPSAITLQLTEASSGKLDPARAEQAATLRVLATAAGLELERYVKVIVAQEGLFIDPAGRSEDGSYHVLADGTRVPTEVEFRVYGKDAEGHIQLLAELTETLEFEHLTSEGSRSRNAADVGNLTWTPEGAPSSTWRFAVEFQIPADVAVLKVPLRVAVPGMDPEKFEKRLLLGLRPSRLAPGGPDWELEFGRCRTIIFDFVPLGHQPKMLDILHRRSRALGADGLAEMRRQIWVIAQNLTLAEGAEGYRSNEKWENRAHVVLEYAQWAGDVAFHAATAHFMGAWYALGSAQLKQLVVSAIQAYEDGLSPSDWLWQNVGALPSIAEGVAVDVDRFAKWTGEDRVKAWALFVSYHFFKSYLYKGMSFTDSLMEAGAQARDEVIASWIGSELRKPAAPARPEVQLPRPATPGKTPSKPAATPGPDARQQKAPVTAAKRAPEFEARTPKERAQKMAEAIKKNSKPTEDGPELDIDTMEKIMRDPDAARELKKNKEAWEAYDRARQKVYKERKEQLEKWIKENVPGAKDQNIDVRPVGHADGVDLDYRAGIVRKNPVTGKEEFIEIEPKHWESKSNEIFGELTGKPADVPADKWAADRQQLATSQYHSQAAPDLADQDWVKDPATGRKVRTQVTPNVDLVKQGESVLHDPDALGKTYETKVADSYYADAPLDGYKQAQKAVQSLEGYTDGDGVQHPGIRDGYRRRGYKVNDPSPVMKKGMQIVDDVVSGKMSPAEGDAALKAAGLGDNLPGFMEKVSGDFARFKFARK